MADYTTDTLNKIGGNQVSAFAQTLPSAQAGLINKQAGESNDFLTRLRQGIAGQEGLPHMVQRFGDQFNIPTLQKAVSGLTSTLANIPETYSKATRGFDVNENQLGRIVGTKSAALAPALTGAQAALSGAQQQQQQMIAATQAEQAKQLKPFESEQSIISDRWAREQTGFTTANGQELDGLIAKMNAGVQLSEGEQQRANQLAVAEKSFQASKYAADQQLAGQRAVALASLGKSFQS